MHLNRIQFLVRYCFVLTVVHQVARNDNNKRTVVTHGAVPLLVKIHNSGNIEEQRG